MVGIHPMLPPSLQAEDLLVTNPPAIYLLEAYRSSTSEGPATLDDLRAALDGSVGIRVLGMLDVPIDEAVLCLVAAETASAAASIREIAGRLGSTARLLEVSWSPGQQPAEWVSTES